MPCFMQSWPSSRQSSSEHRSIPAPLPSSTKNSSKPAHFQKNFPRLSIVLLNYAKKETTWRKRKSVQLTWKRSGLWPSSSWIKQNLLFSKNKKPPQSNVLTDSRSPVFIHNSSFI